MAGQQGISMTQESVNALKNLANTLPEASEIVATAQSNLEASFEEKKDLLGPFTSQMQAVLEKVSEAQETGHNSVIKLQVKLVKAATKLNAILDKGLNVD